MNLPFGNAARAREGRGPTPSLSAPVSRTMSIVWARFRPRSTASPSGNSAKCLFGRREGGCVVLRDAEGKVVRPRRPRRLRVVISRADCDLYRIAAPRGPRQSVSRLIDAALPTLHPAPADGCDHDAVSQGSGAHRTLLTAVVDLATLAMYREAAPGARLTLLCLLLGSPRSSAAPDGPRRFVLCSSDHYEVITLRGREVLSSYLVPRGRPIGTGIGRLSALCEETPPVSVTLVECARDERPGCDREAKALRSSGVPVATASLASLAAMAPRAQALFERLSPAGLASAAAVRLFAAAVLLGASSSLLLLLSTQREARLPAPAVYRETRDGDSSTESLATELERRRAQLRSLESDRPPDLYALFCDMRRAFGDDARLLEASIARGRVRLVCLAERPDLLVARLAAVEHLGSVDLLERSSINSDRFARVVLAGELR